MCQKTFISLLRYKTKCDDLRGYDRLNDRIFERQLGIEGFEPSQYSASKVLMVGAGGLGSEIGEGLVRKGIGELTFVDADTVSVSNLNRQFFTKNPPRPFSTVSNNPQCAPLTTGVPQS